MTASALALSNREAQLFAQALAGAPRPTVIWLSFQQCTGCWESLLRTYNPTIETLLLDVISLDYHERRETQAWDTTAGFLGLVGEIVAKLETGQDPESRGKKQRGWQA